MTKEQEAIEKLTNGEKIYFNTLIRKFKKEGIENFVVTKKEYIETVLSMLKEKDNLINEQLKENVKSQKELNEENKRCMILANNDKFKEQVIDLMAEELQKHIFVLYDGNTITSKKGIIEHFERKATNNG